MSTNSHEGWLPFADSLMRCESLRPNFGETACGPSFRRSPLLAHLPGGSGAPCPGKQGCPRVKPRRWRGKQSTNEENGLVHESWFLAGVEMGASRPGKDPWSWGPSVAMATGRGRRDYFTHTRIVITSTHGRQGHAEADEDTQKRTQTGVHSHADGSSHMEGVKRKRTGRRGHA